MSLMVALPLVKNKARERGFELRQCYCAEHKEVIYMNLSNISLEAKGSSLRLTRTTSLQETAAGLSETPGKHLANKLRNVITIPLVLAKHKAPNPPRNIPNCNRNQIEPYIGGENCARTGTTRVIVSKSCRKCFTIRGSRR